MPKIEAAGAASHQILAREAGNRQACASALTRRLTGASKHARA